MEHKGLFEDIVSDMSDISTRYNPEDDDVNKFKLTDTRKNKLLLKDVNKLKRMRNIRRKENINRKKVLGSMYAIPPATET